MLITSQRRELIHQAFRLKWLMVAWMEGARSGTTLDVRIEQGGLRAILDRLEEHFRSEVDGRSGWTGRW